MKKQLIAAAALATLSGVVAAQNATVYGFLDVGMFSTTNATGGKSLLTGTQSGGNFFPSMWGITGSEDLGGGLKASFNLQSSLNAMGGQSGNDAPLSNGALFDRYAVVSVSGSAGSIQLGHMIDPIFLQTFVNGAMPTHSNSLAVSALLNGSQSANNTSHVVGSRLDNTITYTTPTSNGLKAALTYAAGGVAGSNSAGGIYAGVATYDNAGLSLSAGYESQNSQTGATNVFRKALLGAKYTSGQYTVAAQWLQQKNQPVDSGTAYVLDAYELGVAYKASANTTVGLNYMSYSNQNGALTSIGKNPAVTSLKAKYDLSKRTYLYGMASVQNADAYGIPQGYNVTTGAADKGATNFAVGVVHGF